MQATGSAVVNAPVERIFEFVIDPNEYPKADTKITRMEVLQRSDTHARITARGYLRFPFLQSSLVLSLKLQPYERIEIESEPGSVSLPGRLALHQFKAEFRFEPVDGGIKTTHTETYIMKGSLLGRLAERLGARWLTWHMEQIEIQKLKQIVEAQPVLPAQQKP